jgi:outer membrane protein assembly factor BamB
MFRGNARHTGLSPFDTSGNTGMFNWSFKTGGKIYSSPAVGFNGTIYVGSDDNKLHAIDPGGIEKWNFSIGASGKELWCSPAIDSNGTIYIGSKNYKLYTINPNGTERWNFTTGHWVSSSPVIGFDGTIYVGSRDGNLYAIFPNGTKRWNITVGTTDSSPAISHDGTIYIGSHDTYLYAVNPNGTGKWKFKTQVGIVSSPAIGSDGTIYFGSVDKHIYAVYPNGSERWNFSLNQVPVWHSPAIGSDGVIYMGNGAAKFHAIYPNGTEKWNFTADGALYSPAIGKDGTIYVGCFSNKLYAFNSDGTVKWSYTAGGGLKSSPAIGSDGTIYIGSHDNHVYAIGAPGQNQPPIANAGLDQDIYVNQTVYLNGSGTYDPDNDTLTHKWSFGDGTSTNWQYNCNSSHVYNKSGNYTVTLFVTDGVGGWPSVNDTCIIRVTKGPPLANSPWPMFRQNLQHTGLSPYGTSENTGKLKWQFYADGMIQSSPSIGLDGTIYFGSYDKNLYAVAPNGTKLWSFETDGSIEQSSPAIAADGTIYIGCRAFDYTLYAINSNGTEKWKVYTGGFVSSSPAIGPDGTIYVGSDSLALFAYNPNGSVKWKFMFDDPVVMSSPAIDDHGIIYIGVSGKVFAIYPNGTLKWSCDIGGLIKSSPAIGADGTIYIGHGNFDLNAIYPNGTKRWAYTTGWGIESSPAIGSDGTIYIGSGDQKLHAVNPDGAKKWTFKTENAIESPPAVSADGTIYIGSYDNRLYAINPNGTEKWSLKKFGQIRTSPAIGSDGTIYVGCNEGKLSAIGNVTVPQPPPNNPPIANAGPDQNVTIQQLVNLDGNGSYDPDGDNLTYQWNFGDGVISSWQNASKTSHLYKKTGIFTVNLTVSDGALTDSDTCIIHVYQAINKTPIINSSFKTLIELDEDFDKFALELSEFEDHINDEIFGDNLKWYVTGNSDTIFYITGNNNTGANADTFEFTSIPNKYGTENLIYHLTDPHGFEATVDQTVIVHPVNDPPIANAGSDRNITEGQTINLDANGSYDIEGDALSFQWSSSIDGKLGNGKIIKSIKLSVGNHLITLNVSDSEFTVTDDCIIRVSKKIANVPPLAKITPMEAVFEGEKVSLSARDSFDEDGFIIEYIWNFGDHSEELRTNATEVEHTWTAAGNYTITLMVTDDQSANGTDSLIITVLQSKPGDPVNGKERTNGNTFAIIAIAIVIIILLTIALTKMMLLRSKRQRQREREQERQPESDEEILSDMQNRFLEDEPLPEADYSRSEISELVEQRFNDGQLSEDTYKFIRSEVLFSEEAPAPPPATPAQPTQPLLAEPVEPVESIEPPEPTDPVSTNPEGKE